VAPDFSIKLIASAGTAEIDPTEPVAPLHRSNGPDILWSGRYQRGPTGAAQAGRAGA